MSVMILIDSECLHMILDHSKSVLSQNDEFIDDPRLDIYHIIPGFARMSLKLSWWFHDDLQRMCCVHIFIRKYWSWDSWGSPQATVLNFSWAYSPENNNYNNSSSTHTEISETALRIFLKLCTMLDIKNVKGIARPDFPKKFWIIHKVRKCGQNDGFSTFSRKRL